MAGKKNKKKSIARPVPNHQDSMRRDIAAAQSALSDGTMDGDGDEGFEIADELLAALDARDKADEKFRQSAQHGSDSPHHQSHHHEGETSTSPLREAGGKLLHVGEKIFGGGHHHRSPSGSSPAKSPPTSPQPGAADADHPAGDARRKGSIRRIFGGASSPPSQQVREPNEASATESSADGGRRKVSRQKARMERREAEMEAQRVQAREELKANGGKPDEAERERAAITDLCKAMKVKMHEINPDGHCLYAAVADQLNILGKSDDAKGKGKLQYTDTRKAAAEYMRQHADDFMPFISDSDEHMAGIENKEAGSTQAQAQEKYYMEYCDAVEKTAVWGGQPEIMALSRAFHTPIHVVQAGCPVYKVGSDEATRSKDERPVVISYHRHMYGLGEHYNSLHAL